MTQITPPPFSLVYAQGTDMHDAMKRREVEILHNAGFSIRVRYENGVTDVLGLFAAHLRWSRRTYVEVVPDELEEALIRALLDSFGGVPFLCPFDNPKTIVPSRHDNAIQWNTTFAQVATHYRFAIELCVPRRG